MRRDITYIPPIRARDLSGDIRDQMRDALDVVDTWLTEAGIQRESLLIAHIWLRDMSLFADMTSVWNDRVLPNALPSRSCVSRVPTDPDVLVELEFSALQPAPGKPVPAIERYGLVRGPGRPHMCLSIAFDTWFTACLVPADTRPSASHQTRQILERFDSFLSQASTDRSHIRAVQVWLSDLRDFDTVGAQLRLWLGDTCHPSIVCMRADMATPNIAVEIRIIADQK